MSDDSMLPVEQVLKELQIEMDELKGLLRDNALRYVVEENGKIKIPKMALMALKLERMTSTTQQFAKVKRASRKGASSLTVSGGEKSLSIDETLKMLHIDREKLDEYIRMQRVRVVEVEGEERIPAKSADTLQLQLTSFGTWSTNKNVEKNKPGVRRVY
jgi:predicted site-specific integrase-resolvase